MDSTSSGGKIEQPRRVFDCFIFGWELDMLQWRLSTLEDTVDTFVIVEAPSTHRGTPKPLHYEENQERFLRWSDRIVHVVATLPKGGPWDREQAQRHAILRGLEQARDDDVVIVSDLDEMPDPRVVRELRLAALEDPLSLEMFGHKLTLDLREPDLIRGPFAARRCDLDDPNRIRRAAADGALSSVKGAGWHFSYLLPEETLVMKLESFPHAELDRPAWKSAVHLRRCLQLGVDFVWGSVLERVPIDGLPVAFRDAASTDPRFLAPPGSGTGGIVARAYGMHVPMRRRLPSTLLDLVPPWGWVPLMPATLAYKLAVALWARGKRA